MMIKAFLIAITFQEDQKIFIINRNGKIIYKGTKVTEELIVEAINNNSIATKIEKKLSHEVITNGGFSPGQDPLYNGMHQMLNDTIPTNEYFPNPKLLHHFIIRPSINNQWGGGYGWNQVNEHIGVTYYDGKLTNIFQFLNQLSSTLWVSNKTNDTLNYDIIYWKKSPNIDHSLSEIQNALLKSLEMKLNQNTSKRLVNKLALVSKNEKVVYANQIEKGAEKTYFSVDQFVLQLERKTQEFFIVDASLKDKYISNIEMDFKKLATSTSEEILAFLEKSNIKSTKVNKEITTYDLVKL